MTELQALGAALVALPESQLAQMQLDANLLQAVLEAKRIRTHEAKRRQLQYIGRLMREVDPEPVRARLAAIEGGSAQAAAAHRRLEQWREGVMSAGAPLTRFPAQHT